jgi:hypothetical protein
VTVWINNKKHWVAYNLVRLAFRISPQFKTGYDQYVVDIHEGRKLFEARKVSKVRS